MCQLNLYIVPKTMNKESVLEIMKNVFPYQNPECVTSENLLEEVQDFNNVYISAAMGCNCGTIQTSFQNNSDAESWCDVKKQISQEKIEKLKEIKRLLERSDYLEYKNETLKKSGELENKLKEAKGDEYLEVLNEWQLFFKENGLLYEAMMKYEKHEVVDGKDIIYNNIDEEILNVEKNEFVGIESEYEDLIKFVDAILEEVDEVKFLSFWQDGDNPYVKNEKFVFRKDLKIEDFIFLKDNELLTVFAD